jgi:dTDP-4-amino-4,6-dideoxygalactose transaminase
VEKDTEKRFKGERSWSFDVLHQGYRYHMSNLMAAIGREQLKKIDRFSAHRQQCVARYRRELAGGADLVFLDLDYDNIVSHIFVIRVKQGRRDALMEHLRANGIECGIHYQPNHLLTYFATDYALPEAEALGAELLTLPLHAVLASDEQATVIAAVRGFLEKA